MKLNKKILLLTLIVCLLLFSGCGGETSVFVETPKDDPFPVMVIDFNKVRWTTPTDFNKGTFNNTEVFGNGTDAVIKLEENPIEENNILYNNISNNAGSFSSGNYISNVYDTTKEYNNGYINLSPLIIGDSSKLSVSSRTSQDNITFSNWSVSYDASNGFDITQTGRYIQWRAEFNNSATLGTVDIEYKTPYPTILKP